MKICNVCPSMDVKGTRCMVPGTQPCCAECGCSLGFKLRAHDSQCPHPDGAKWLAEKV